MCKLFSNTFCCCCCYCCRCASFDLVSFLLSSYLLFLLICFLRLLLLLFLWRSVLCLLFVWTNNLYVCYNFVVEVVDIVFVIAVIIQSILYVSFSQHQFVSDDCVSMCLAFLSLLFPFDKLFCLFLRKLQLSTSNLNYSSALKMASCTENREKERKRERIIVKIKWQEQRKRNEISK